MSAPTKIQPPHQARQAVVYVRQSTTKQLAVNQESTRRQYQLADRAHALGWPVLAGKSIRPPSGSATPGPVADNAGSMAPDARAGAGIRLAARYPRPC